MTMTAGKYKNNAHLRILTLTIPKMEILKKTQQIFLLGLNAGIVFNFQIGLNVLEHGLRNKHSF